MLNFTNLPHGSEAELIRIAAKRAGDDESLRWDYDLAFSVSNARDMKAVDNIIPGAAELIGKGEEKNIDLTSNSKTKVDDVLFTVYGIEEDGEDELMSCRAEVRWAKLVVKGPISKCTVRFRTKGTGEQRGALFDWLGCQVRVDAEAMQMSLPMSQGTDVSVEPGQVATVDGDAGTWAGIVKRIEEDGTVKIKDIIGKSQLIDPKSVISSEYIAVENGTTLTKVIASYKERCSRHNATPSWSAILEALGRAMGRGEAPTNDKGVWMLTDDVIDDAIGGGGAQLFAVPNDEDAAGAIA